MKEKKKKIRKVGSSAGVIFDKDTMYKAEMEIGDNIIITCSRYRITIKKIKEKINE